MIIKCVSPMTTKCVSVREISEKWYIVNAQDITLGKLASCVARILRGKHLPQFSPHMNFLQKVIVVNASKVRVTGHKMEDKKYYHHTGYIGNLKEISFKNLIKKHPARPVEMAIKGMLPHNRLGSALYRNLFVYSGEQHKHQAQKPISLEI